MSHIRNLFHMPSGHEHIPSTPSVAAIPENLVNVVNVATAAPALPEFSIEQAHLVPENRLVYTPIRAARRPTGTASSG